MHTGSLFLTLIILWSCSGCSEVTQATYNNGTEFVGINGRFHILNWTQSTNPPNTCPLAIHLPDKAVLNPKEFSSPETLKKHGGNVRVENGSGVVRFDEGSSSLIFFFENDELKSVHWIIPEDSTSKYRLAIDEKELLLPISKKDLLNTLGPPDHLNNNPP